MPEADESDWVDPSAGVVLVEREVAASWAGRPLGEIEIPGVARAVAVGRMGTAQIATPDLVTQDGDVVYLAVAIGHVSDVDEHLGGARRPAGASTSEGRHRRRRRRRQRSSPASCSRPATRCTSSSRTATA